MHINIYKHAYIYEVVIMQNESKYKRERKFINFTSLEIITFVYTYCHRLP